MALYEETKQLQEERNAKFPGVEPVIPQKSFTELFQENAYLFKNLNYKPAPVLETTPVEIDRPDSWARRLGRFYNPTLEQENLLAEQQSGLQRMAYIIPRIATKAVSEIAQMPGYLGGAIAWGLHGFKQEDIGLAVNNWWQKGIQSIEQGVKDRLPVYTSDVIKSGNIWDNIFSTAFWANEGADGAGFLLAFLAPGAALRGLGVGAKAAKLIKPGTTVYKDLMAGAKTEEIAAALAGEKFAGNINDVISTVVNTLFESSAEAGQSFDTVLDKTGDRNKAAEAAVDVMTKNFGILGLSNYIDQKWLFGNSKLIREYAEKGLAKELTKGNLFSRVLDRVTGAPLDAVTKRTALSQVGQLGKTITKGFLKEGFYEEGMQYVAQKRAEAGTPNDEGFINELIDVGKSYVDSMTDLDFQKSVLLGGLMGSMMAGVQTVREIKSEDKLLGNFHELIKNNKFDWTTGYSDLIQKDGEGNLMVDDNGKYIPDTSKGKEFLAKKFTSYLRNKQMIDFAKTGNTEAFEAARNEKIFEQFIPFLQVEGGLQAAYTYINNLAEADVKYMQAEGIATKDVNEVKQELRDKVTKFQQIYDRVNDTHDLNLSTKYLKEDKAIYNSWSDKVKENKIGDEVFMQFAGERISDLRNQLASFKMSDSNVASITSDETKISPKIVEDLQKTLDTFKPSIMTKTDISNAEMLIKSIDGYVKSSLEAREDLANLYNKKFLNNSYKTFKEYKTQSPAEATASAVDTAKKTATAGLIPELSDLYNKAVRFEPIGDDIVQRLGEVSTTFTDKAGNPIELVGEVIGKNDSGGLNLNVLRSTTGIVGAVASINPDGTITYSGEVFTPTIKPVVTKPPIITVYKPEDVTSVTPVADGEVSTAHDEGAKTNQAYYDKEAKHVFDIGKGVSNWLFSTGNQKQVVNNDNLGRWHLFVNKLADTRLSTGEHKYYVKTYTFKQVGELSQTDPIRQLVTFYTGEIETKTYDRIEDKNNVEVNEDIKVVIFDKTTNMPLRVGVNGEITTEDKSQIVFNSLPKAKVDTPEMKERLATNRIESDYLTNQLNVPPTREAEETEKASAKVWANIQVENSRLEYEKFRESLKSESTTLQIDTINPGVKLTDGAVETPVLEASRIPSINLLASRIHTEAVKTGGDAYGWNSTRNISGSTHRIRNGFWYVEGIDNRIEVIKPKTLGETNSIEAILKLMQSYATTSNEKLEQFFKNILYMGVNNVRGELSPYRLFFAYKRDANDKPIKGSLDKLVFGEDEITIDEFLAGTSDDKLRSFLSTKFWNFNNKLKNDKTFTEYTVDKDGKLIQNIWEPTDGGYIGFLFSTANNNSPKGSILMRPQETQGLKSVLYENANYVNQSLNFIQPGVKVEPVIAPNNKITEIPIVKDNIFIKNKIEQDRQDSLHVVTAEDLENGLDVGLTVDESGVWTGSYYDINDIWREDFSGTKELVITKLNARYDAELVALTKSVTKPKTRKFGELLAEQGKPVVTIPTIPGNEIINELTQPIVSAPVVTVPVTGVAQSYEEFLTTVWNESEETRMTFDTPQNAWAIYKSANNIHLDREVTAYDNYERENLVSAKTWLKEKFPEIPVEIIDGLIDNKSWGRLTKSSLILLSSIAATGTAYHEGFHVFSQLVLSDVVRKELYDEVRNRLNNQDLTDRQAEEYLAEEFREYMIAPNSYTFAKNEVQKRTFFEKILDFILKVFHITKSDKKDFRIEQTFRILEEGSFGVTAKELPSDLDRNRIAKLSNKETLLFVKDLNYVFFNEVLFNPDADFTENSLFNLDNTLDVLYGAVKGHYMFNKKLKDRDLILENFDAIKKEHIRFIRQFKIDTRGATRIDEDDMTEDEVDDKASNSLKDYLQVNMSDVIKDPVKLLVASLATDDGRVVGTLSGYKTRSTVRFNKTVSFLKNTLAGLGTDFDNYVIRLEELSQFRPELKVLLKRLGADKKSLTKNLVILQSAFVNSFGSNKSIPNIFRYTFEGGKYFFNPVEDSNNRVLRRRWMNNARGLLNTEGSYIMRSGAGSRGKLIINTNLVRDDITKTWKLKDKSDDRLKAYIKVLDKLGIKISDNIDSIQKYGIINDYITYLAQEISARKGKELAIQDLYNADVIQNQLEVNKLVEYAKKFMTNDDDLSYYNQDGNREYSIGLNSHNSNVVNNLNRITINPSTGETVIPTEVEYLMPYDGKIGSIYNRHSKWATYSKSGGKIDYVLLKGMTTPNPRLGAEVSKTFFGDYKSLEFNALLSGIVPHLRASDRKTEYSFFVGKPDYNVSRDAYKADMLNYLRDELSTSFALLLDPDNWGGNLENYSTNARTLRVFNFIYDKEFNSNESFIPASLEDFVSHPVPEGITDTLAKADNLTEQFINDYSGYIDRSFDRFITRDMDFNEQLLKEDKLIVEEMTVDNKKSLGIKIPGLAPNIITDEDKFNIKRDYSDRINRAELERILLFHSYTQFVGANEQLKLFMGDLAFWGSPIDFHKRLTGATSPKQTLADGATLYINLEKLFKRVDGKDERTPSISVLVVPDVIVKNEALSKISPKYDHINSTDASSAPTLDELRDIKIREGDWNPHFEKTFQWEMQNFILRMLELKKTKPDLPFMNKISEGMFTDPSGIFYEHTNGKLPKIPMFQGSELKVKELGILTMMKPQGFGPIANIKGLNATQYLKTAFGHIFPSSIQNDNPMLPTLLSMLDNQQGLLAFRSSMKGTVSSGIQELNYRDLGIQLDVSEKGKIEVTASTQQQRLLFSNIYDRGKLIEKFSKSNLGNLHNEFINLINEIVEMKREYIINRFGLVKNEATGVYGLPDTAKARKVFEDALIEAFEHRLMPNNILDGIELALESNEKIFDVTPSKFKIEEVLMAEIRHHVISRKTSGDMLIQESPVMYNESLKFYDGENAIEVIVALPYHLVDWCESIGGIDALNKAIASHDTKLLGKDFFEILNVPMNRIPCQSLNTIDVARIKKFLPHYHGAKVVLPAEITVKANSDFDVDKMTSYLNNFEVDKETNKIRYYTDITTLEGKQNRINEIIKEAVLDKGRFEELVDPLNADHIKKLADWAREKTYNRRTPIEREVNKVADASLNGDYKWHNVLAWWYNMQLGREFFASKRAMATANINNVANARAQVLPVRMKSWVPLFFKGQHLGQDQEYNTGFLTDSDGYSISKNYAGFVTAFVDSVKDKFVFELVDDKTYNIVATLNRYGVDTGIGLDSLAAFMTQDVLIDYFRTVRSNQSRFLRMNEYSDRFALNFEKQYATTIANLRERLGGTEKNVPTLYHQTVAASFQKLLGINKRGLTPEEIKDKTTKILAEIQKRIDDYGYKDFSRTDLRGDEIRTNFKDQVQVLDNYLMYKLLSDSLTGLNMMLRPDARSSMYKHISAVQGLTGLLYQKLEEEGLFNLDDVQSAVFGNPVTGTPSLIAEYYRTKDSVVDIFGWSSMIFKDPVIHGFFYDNVYSMFGHPKRFLKKNIIDRIYTNVESDFLTFVMADMYNLKDFTELQSKYKEISMGDNSVPKRLLKLKGIVIDNLAIDELEPNIAQRILRSRTLAETDTISTYNRSLEPYTIDAIASDLYSFATETTDDNKRFAADLVMHAVFQSGFHSSSNSYMHVIPPRLFIDLSQDAITRFLALPEETKLEKLNSFLEQMYRNNSGNSQIVPKYNRQIGSPLYWNLSESDAKFYANWDYIAVNHYTANPKPYRKTKVSPPTEVLLYRRIPGRNQFQRITKLGEGLNFKEFYPMLLAHQLDGVSIIESSNYKKLPLDVTFEESNLAEKSETTTPADEEQGYEPDDIDQDTDSSGEIPPEYDSEFEKTFDSTMMDKGYVNYIGENETNYYTKILNKEAKPTINRVLRLIEDKSSDRSIAELARVLRFALSSHVVPLTIDRSLESDSVKAKEFYKTEGTPIVNGKYFYFKESLSELGKYKDRINIYEKLTDKGFEVTAVHEAIHALSQYAYDNNKVGFKDKLDKIVEYTTWYLSSNGSKEIRDYVEANIEAFTDAGEFLSYAFSHSNFQDVLARVPAENPDLVDNKLVQKSVLSQFLDTIFSLLREYWNKFFGTTSPDYNERVQKMTSVLHDLIALVQEDLLTEKKEPSIIKEIPIEEVRNNMQVKEKNMQELGKELNANFDELYKDYNYLSQIEKDTYQDAVNKGIIELSCGL